MNEPLHTVPADGTHPPGQTPRKQWGFFKKALLLLLLAVLAGGGYALWDALHFLNTPPEAENPQAVRIEIRPGATFDRVAWDLYKAGAITDVARFRLLARFQEKLGSVQAGEFEVNTGWLPKQVLTHITSGRAILYRLSIREGLTWWEVARIVEESGFALAEEFKAVIHDPEFLRRWGIPFANAEGFLFPETYLLRKPRDPGGRAQAEEIANLLVGSFWKHTWPVWQEYAAIAGEAPGASVTIEALSFRDGTLSRRATGRAPDSTAPDSTAPDSSAPDSSAPDSPASDSTAPDSSASDQTPDKTPEQASDPASPPSRDAARGLPQYTEPPPPAVLPVSAGALRRLVILASLVEKETGIPEERARVAGVYTNRMRIGMLLQCDPTILYGLGESYSGPIRRSHLADAGNLYNTYIHPGLPPGPLCSPGLASIRAAAAPEDHAYLYFVANGGDGSHSFSTNLREHQRAVDRYRAWERGRR